MRTNSHTILVADDEVNNLHLVAEFLRELDCRILVARDGKSALAKAQYGHPDLILLDVLMPGMDGFEVCRRLKADESLRDIPVIFLSSLAETGDKVRGFQVGAVDYITKPFQQEEVVARLDNHLRLRALTCELQEAKQALERQNEQLESEIAERRLTEEALHEKEQQLRTLINAMPDIVIFKDGQGRYLEANDFALRFFGLENVDYRGKTDGALAVFTPFYQNAFETCEETDEAAWRAQTMSRSDEIIPRPDGSSLIFDVIKVPTFHPDGCRKGLLVVGRDVTERKQAEQVLCRAHAELERRVEERTAELRQANEQLAQKIEERKRAMVRQAAIYHISEATQTTLSLDELFASLHGTIAQLMPAQNFYIALYDAARETIHFPYYADEFDTTPPPQKMRRGLTEFVLRTGKSLLATQPLFEQLVESGQVESLGAPSVDWLGVPLKTQWGETIGVMAVQTYTEDVRLCATDQEILEFVSTQAAMAIERKRAQEEKEKLQAQMGQVQKMEALGQLAGGIAHDFNNLLTVIQLNAVVMKRRLLDGDPLAEHACEIAEATERAARLVRQLLSFGRQEIIEPRLLSLNDIIGDLAPMLRRIIGTNIELKTASTEDLWPVKADPSQMEQVLVNLVMNARDAMPKGGTLIIETNNVVLDETYTARHVEAQLGEHVRLTIGDTGVGMSAEVKTRIFEPFFTTKERGQGTGLGLATVFGIVKQNGGHLQVTSQVGQGTTFDIYLPRALRNNGAGILPFSQPG